ncbi:MAG: hypothetical protein ACI4HI_18065 [Lachnospiraceae bacterium]
MRKKHIVGTCMLVAALLTCSACGEKTTSQNKTVSEKPHMEDNRIYGEVKHVDADSITIAIGTREQPKEQEDASSSSFLDLTGEEKEITISEDTKIVRQTMGGRQMGERPDGEAPKDMPSGERPDGEAPKDMPSGERPDDGNGKQMPEEMEETIEVSDIAEGDVIAVSQESDGTTEKISLISFESTSQEKESSQQG